MVAQSGRCSGAPPAALQRGPGFVLCSSRPLASPPRPRNRMSDVGKGPSREDRALSRRGRGAILRERLSNSGPASPGQGMAGASGESFRWELCSQTRRQLGDSLRGHFLYPPQPLEGAVRGQTPSFLPFPSLQSPAAAPTASATPSVCPGPPGSTVHCTGRGGALR